MGKYQIVRGNPEVKSFYLVDQLIGGINTEFSDDNSRDNEFNNLVNFEMDNQGSLNKRLGFGKLNAVSEIFAMFENLPDVKPITPENPNPSLTNDNVVYMKLIKNDNNVFGELANYIEEKGYREYQRVFGSQNNSFEILIITTNYNVNTSTAWLYKVTLAPLEYDGNGQPTDTETIIIEEEKYDLPVLFKWNKNLTNISTIEYADKIYFTENNKALVTFDRSTNTFTYKGYDITGVTNTSYKPNSMEVRKVGFNLLGDNPLYWVDYQGITTDSIQGIYITTTDNKPSLVVPNGGKFRLNILYTGSDSGFTFELKEGENKLTFISSINTELSKDGLKVYDITINEVPTTEIEIKITKIGATIDPYYDYYQVGAIDQDIREVKALNAGEYKILEMYNRAVYYKEDIIYFSEINAFDYVPNYNYVTLPIEPTDEITKIVFFKNVYIIFTKYRIYKMIGQFGTTDFQVMPVNESIGCHAPNTAIHIGNELYFTSKQGLYSLKSSDFRDGIENLNELDVKVKSLTRDRKLFVGDLTDPLAKSVAIEEYAYAIRYNDKYMLFYNNYDKDRDNEDVLVYKYNMKAYTQFRFAIKPTFLFMVDGKITTFATVPEKEEFTDEMTVLEYDFTEGLSDIITDLSGNNLDGKAIKTYSQPGIGVSFDGIDDFVKISQIPETVNLQEGFRIDTIVKPTEFKDKMSIFDLGQVNPISTAGPSSGSIFTNWSNGYRAELRYRTTPSAVNNTSTVNYDMYLHRDNTSRNATQTGSFNLKEGTLELIPNIAFTFNFVGNSLETKLVTSSFIINHNTDGSYEKNWNLSLTTKFPTYTTTYNKGPTQYLNRRQAGDWNTQFGIRFNGRAEARDYGARVFLTPAVSLNSGASLYTGARDLYAWINGVQKNYSIPAISTAGPADIYATGEQYVDVYYTGQPTIKIDGRYNIRSTIGGVYREDVNVAEFDFTMPSVIPVTTTTWTTFTVTGLGVVKLDRITEPSKREIYALVNDNGTVSFGINSEFGKYIATAPTELVLNEYNNITFIVTKRLDLNFDVSIIINNTPFTGEVILNNRVKNTLKDSALIGGTNSDNNYFKGDVSLFRMLQQTNKVVEYVFNDGRGTTVSDISGNTRFGAITGASWIVENGIKFNGIDSYIAIPELNSNLPFSNGFTIEFEAKIESVEKMNKVIDLATTYNTGESSNLKSSINIGVNTNSNAKLIDFMTTSIDMKTYKVSKTNVELPSRHKWKMSCIDNGKGYTMSVYCDGVIISTAEFNYGGITNIIRKSNFIGRSNNPTEGYLKGMLYNLKITINKSPNPLPIFEGNMYEFDTSYSDFDRPMYLEIDTKATNMNYPQHQKKLKNIIIKGLGGYYYVDFLTFVNSDGHLINNPYIYEYYVDPDTQQVVYEYSDNRELLFNEKLSILGNMRLDNTRLGESIYENRKLVTRGKGKNFGIKIVGESSDYLKIESFGYLFKIGKVKG